MSFLKLNGGAGMVLVALVLLAASSEAARAEATTLVCNLEPFEIKEDEPTTIELNEAQSSVIVHFSATHWSEPGPGHGPAKSLGPLPAKFDTDTITFHDPSSEKDGDYIINRLTGNFHWVHPNWNWTCHAAKKQF